MKANTKLRRSRRFRRLKRKWKGLLGEYAAALEFTYGSAAKLAASFNQDGLPKFINMGRIE